MGIARFAAIADWPLVRVRLRPLESQRAASRGDVPGTLWECGASLEGGESLPGRLARHVSYIISSHEQKRMKGLPAVRRKCLSMFRSKKMNESEESGAGEGCATWVRGLM
jgi:hypothetical protein